MHTGLEVWHHDTGFASYPSAVCTQLLSSTAPPHEHWDAQLICDSQYSQLSRQLHWAAGIQPVLLSLAQEHLALPALPGALSQNHPHTEHQTVTGQSETEPQMQQLT